MKVTLIDWKTNQTVTMLHSLHPHSSVWTSWNEPLSRAVTTHTNTQHCHVTSFNLYSLFQCKAPKDACIMAVKCATSFIFSINTETASKMTTQWQMTTWLQTNQSRALEDVAQQMNSASAAECPEGIVVLIPGLLHSQARLFLSGTWERTCHGY